MLQASVWREVIRWLYDLMMRGQVTVNVMGCEKDEEDEEGHIL
jgi:hypothetical protein